MTPEAGGAPAGAGEDARRSGSLRCLLAAALIAALPASGCDRAGEPAPGTGAQERSGEGGIPRIDFTTLPEALRLEAEEERRRALDGPDDAGAVGALGMRCLALDFFEAAAACLERAARLEPREMKWRYYLAMARERTGDVSGAAASLEEALALRPDYGPAMVRLARLRLEADRTRARELYLRALEADPRDAAALFGLATCARLEGRREEAIGWLRRAVESRPDDADAHYALATLLAASGRRGEAREHLRRHAAGSGPPAERDPLLAEVRRLGESAAVLRRRAASLERSGEVGEAVRLLERSIEADVSGSTSHIHLGVVLARQGEFEKAAGHFRSALAADPDNVEAKSSLGLALTEMGQAAEAERLYREVLARHPDHAPALVYLGQLLSRAGRPEEGLEALRRGVAAQPGNGLFQLTLGEALARAGRGEEAIDHLRRAARLLPGHAGARHALGSALARAGRREEARAALEEAVGLAPAMAPAHLGLAELALEEGDAAAAVRLAEKACELTGYARPDFLLVLARAYEAAGQPARAEQLRRRAAGPS